MLGLRRVSILLLLALVLSACGSREIQLNRPCDTDPSLVLTKLTITKEATTAEFRFDAYRDTQVRVYPPGSPNAFFITRTDQTEKYALLNIEGIAVAPNETQLRSGNTLTFTLTFEPIPASVDRIHIIEGEGQMSGTPWVFMNVELK